ncbi:MAG: restriction endonuclease, partial [Burkholderiaceae bacterium]|nr:restriction endonuclease [Burkholderiaceae bacterium]
LAWIGPLSKGYVFQGQGQFVSVAPGVASAVSSLNVICSRSGLTIDWHEWACQRVISRVTKTESTVSVAAGDGDGFEELCASRFSALGWHVTSTPRTGDQGVDLLARRGGLTVAVQCKNYGDPAGNSCVQEVYAGARFHEADFSIVLARSGFTTSARSLASRLGVKLDHPDLLLPARASELDAFVRPPSQ